MDRSLQKPKNLNRSGITQSERFIDKARELGCAEDEVAFEDKLRRLAKVKPQPKKDEASKTQKKAGYEKDH